MRDETSRGEDDGPTVVLFGAFDYGYPRERLIARALHSVDIQTVDCRPHRVSTVAERTLPDVLLPVRLLIGLVAHLRREEVDSVLVMRDNLMLLPVARVATAVFGVRLAVDAFDPDYHNARMKGHTRLRLALLWIREFVALRLADVCLATTRAFVELYAETYRLSSERFAVVPPGADEDTFSPVDVSPTDGGPVGPARGEGGGCGEAASDRSDASAPHRGAEETDRLDVAYWGNFHPHHGVDVVLDAAERLADDDVAFTLAGDGDRRGRYVERARDRGLGSVTFPGRLPDDELRATIAAADVCLGVFSPHRLAQCSLTNKVLEGMAMGKPVVTERSPATDEIDDAVVRVPPGSGEALAGVLRALADDPSRRGALAERARAAFEERYSERAIGERLREALLCDG